MSGEAPYRSTPVFDETTIPAGLRRAHRTKAGAWGVIRVLEGRLRLSFSDGRPDRLLTPDEPGLVRPGEEHQVEPLGTVRMRVDFYDAPPTAIAG